LHRDTAVERWSRVQSFLHARDARAKLVALLIFLIAVSTARAGAHIAFAMYAILLLAAAATAKLPMIPLLLRATLVLPFSATFAVISWVSGDPARALVVIEKSLLCGFATLLLIATTPLQDLLRALDWFALPRPFILVLQFIYRYLFVISEQAQHMRMAAQCRRGLGKNSKNIFSAAAGALGVLFARSWERADGVYRAMLARGFNGRFPRIAPATFRLADALFLFAAAAVSIGVRFAI
jgi:cobalt/nickel transport system permease protein